MTTTQEAVRMRYIARCQIGALHLHQDLCMRVLVEYGCDPVLIPNPNISPFPSPDDDLTVVVASWPRPGQSERGQYAMAVLPLMVERVLKDTEQQDAKFAAHALGDVEELLKIVAECVVVYEQHRDNQPTGHLWPDPNHIYYARAAVAKVKARQEREVGE